MSRRNTFDVFKPSAAPRWFVVRSMQGSVLESRELGGGDDLKRVFICAMLEMMDAGWQVGEFSSTAPTFFCSRNQDRRMVSIDPTDPYDVPMYGGAHLGGCQNCED